MSTTIYTNPVNSVTVFKETKDDYKKVALPYVISATFGGKNLLTVDLLPFIKTGKKGNVDPYFSFVIDGNYNVSIKLNNIANTKGYVNHHANPIVNLSETVVNHWLKGNEIHNNGNVFYYETYLLGYAVLPLIKHKVEGNLSKKLGYAIRVEKLSEYATLHAFSTVVSTCPLTQAILTAVRDKLATLTPPTVNPVPLASDNPVTVDQHKTLANNPVTTNPANRQDNGNGSEPLPPLSDEQLLTDSLKAKTKAQLYDYAKGKGLTVKANLNHTELVETIVKLELSTIPF